MAKRIKMVLYADPGTGKSVFASKFPKPFFICTDGNYEWLTDFGVDPNAHKDCSSYSEIITAMNDDYSNYETIVLDLAEDAFKWCEQEYCVRNKIEHVSDFGYGKGYDATRNTFFVDICKLLAMDKNIIILMHGVSWTEKDRRGVEHWKYGPTDRIPNKVIKMIEGRVRYFLRAYVKDEEHDDGTVTKRRMLSLVPKPNEFGIIRGVDENVIPQDIDLEVDDFLKAVNLTMTDICDSNQSAATVPTSTKSRKVEPKKEEPVEEPVKVETTVEESVKTKQVATIEEPVKTEPTTDQSTDASKPLNNEEKLAAIRAKLAKLKS